MMASDAQPAPPRRTRAGGLLLLLLLAAALVAGGGYGLRQWQARQAQALAAAEQRQHALDDRIAALKQGQGAQSQRLQQAEATNRVLREELLGINQRAALLEDSVSKLANAQLDASRALRLDEIELLLGIGQQRLQLDGDLDGARRALALAAPLLDAIGDPAYLNLRQTLAQEQAALGALGPDPRARADTLLDGLAANIDAVPPADTAPRGNLRWYQRVLDRLVRVRPTAGATLAQPADRSAAIAALQVELSLARAAVAQRDPDALAAALARIEGWLRRLLPASKELERRRIALAELRALPLRQESPLAGSTLQQLRSLRGR